MSRETLALVLLGHSVEGRPIEALVLPASNGATTMVLGGFHGDEPKGVHIAGCLAAAIEADPEGIGGSGWIVVPVVNPDGYERRRRRNANRVDINRNFPTGNWRRSAKRTRMYGGDRPGSEPETRIVIDAVTRFAPSRIITIHSINQGRQCNNYDGPAKALADAMGRINRYPVTASIGYPTPGSFGTWAGVERNIPTVTLELPSHHSSKRCWDENRRALLNPFDPSVTDMPNKDRGG